ncbi:MAG: hypothetical protein ACI909_004240 [Planctomycetota bacterium]|jgi:hypothetical protein
MSNDESNNQSLLHKQAIHEVLLRFARGIDRCDLQLLKTVFWEDCVVDYGKLGGAAWEFFTTVLSTRSETDVTHHQITNVLIELNRNKAQVESYVTAHHFVKEEGKDMDMTAGGRYLDTFEQRNTEWRIVKRLFIMDWNQNVESTARWDTGLHAQFTHHGAHFPEDILYKQFTKKKLDSN